MTKQSWIRILEKNLESHVLIEDDQSEERLIRIYLTVQEIRDIERSLSSEETKLMMDFKMFLRESNAIEGVYDDFSFLKAQEAWDYLMSQDVLTVHSILKTHSILMVGKLKQKDIGAFRTCDVRVGDRVLPHFDLVPELMIKWVQSVMNPDLHVHSIIGHIEFERIHPFVDGNGRVGRMLLNWVRLKRTKDPFLIILESEKSEYYKWFNDGSFTSSF